MCGALICGVLYALLHSSGFSTTASFILAVVFSLAPGTILYEHWLFYTYPLALFLLLAVLMLRRYHLTRRPAYLVFFLIIISIVCLTWALFHFIYLAGAAVLVFLFAKTGKRTVFTAAVIVCAFVASFYVKNYLLFGVCNLSSWMGMNLWNITEFRTSPAQIKALIAKGAAPAILETWAFSDITLYPPRYQNVPQRFRAIPSLANPYKSNGMKNLNHYGYIGISREYMQGALSAIADHPGNYLKSIAGAFALYCQPSVFDRFFTVNYTAVSPYIAATVFWQKWGRFTISGASESVSGSLFSMFILSTVLMVITIHATVMIARSRASGISADPSFVFMVMTILYVALVGNTFEIFENGRFRAVTDPLYYLSFLISVKAFAFRSLK